MEPQWNPRINTVNGYASMERQNLTDRIVKAALPADGRRREIRDGKQRGLVLRISPTGTKSWSALYRRRGDGRRRRVTIGTYPEVSLADARTNVLGILAKVSKGADPATRNSSSTRDRPTTFGELAQLYIDRHALETKRSGHQDKQMLEKDVIPVLCNTKLIDVERHQIAAIIQRIIRRGSPIQANRTFEIVRGLYNWGVSVGLVDSNPCIGLKAPAPELARDRVLSTAELRTFWHGLPEAPMSESVRQILRLCLVTGQRVSEVAGARIDELDFDAMEWGLPGDRVKNSNAHAVPLSNLATHLFKKSASTSLDQPFIFPGRGTGKPVTGHAVAKAMKRSLDSLELNDITPHDLRRTAATYMAKLKVPRLIIDKVLNHVSVDRSTVVGVYDRYAYSDEKRDALDQWSTQLQRLLELPHRSVE